jgi:hypothetical protein
MTDKHDSDPDSEGYRWQVPVSPQDYEEAALEAWLHAEVCEAMWLKMNTAWCSSRGSTPIISPAFGAAK